MAAVCSGRDGQLGLLLCLIARMCTDMTTLNLVDKVGGAQTGVEEVIVRLEASLLQQTRKLRVPSQPQLAGLSDVAGAQDALQI